MTFFHVTLDIRSSKGLATMIVEHEAPDLPTLLSHIYDQRKPWLLGVEHRTIPDGDARKWINNETAVSADHIVRISQILAPESLEAALRERAMRPFSLGTDQEAA
jgi:hypothetical protein